MGMSANLHGATEVCAFSEHGATWLQIKNEKGDYVAVFMPFDVALRMSAAFNMNFEVGSQAVIGTISPSDYSDANTEDFDDGNITPS